MRAIQETITLLHHAVQEHGDEGTTLGQALQSNPLGFFESKVGWQWPLEYREVLDRHDGFTVGNVHVYSFLRSFELFLLLREELEPQNLWPISSDGCGNYFAINLSAEPCEVAFLEAMSGYRPEASERLASLSEWLNHQIRTVCEEADCHFA